MASINATPADLSDLLAINPLAAEQLKNIVLQRRIRELEAELSTNGTGKKPEKVT
jgi:hypothetical protein